VWKDIAGIIKELVQLIQQTRRNTDDIRGLREEMQRLSRIVEKLAYEIHSTRENDSHEREKLSLIFENKMLRLERRLLSSKSEDDPDEND
jgi:predicted  nucleic acid-binding Zn-ribbon protein